jgi:hypothetical protein
MTWTRLVAGRNTDCLHLRPDGTKGNLSETGGRVGAGGVGVRREGRTKNAENWSHDGKYLLYNSKSAQASPAAYLYVLPLAGDRKPIPLVNTEFDTSGGRFSPNDRWLAHRSTETNKHEVYVQGFTLDPSQSRGKWQISTGEEESTPDGAATGKSCSTALVAPSSQWT